MDGDEAPDDGSVRLGHSGGFARPLSRLLLLACGFGVAIALARGASLPEADGGFTEPLIRTLLALGLAVVGISCVLPAIGRWLGRPAELSAAAVRAPRWRGEQRGAAHPLVRGPGPPDTRHGQGPAAAAGGVAGSGSRRRAAVARRRVAGLGSRGRGHGPRTPLDEPLASVEDSGRTRHCGRGLEGRAAVGGATAAGASR